jgi:tetratricopeptide (TPR) repeat protein
MEAMLSQYLRNGHYRTTAATLPSSAKITAPFQLASPAVMAITFARLASLAGHKELARKHAEEAVRLAPTSADSYTALAWARLNANELDAAYEAAERAVQLNGQDPGTLWLLDEALYRKTKATGKISLEEAREIALLSKAAISRRPSIKSAYVKLAAALPMLEEKEITEQDNQFLQLGQKLFPYEPAIQIGRAQLAQMRGEKEDALKMLEAVASNFPQTLTAEQRQQVQDLRSLWASSSKIENAPPAEKEPTEPVPQDSAMEPGS